MIAHCFFYFKKIRCRTTAFSANSKNTMRSLPAPVKTSEPVMLCTYLGKPVLPRYLDIFVLSKRHTGYLVRFIFFLVLFFCFIYKKKKRETNKILRNDDLFFICTPSTLNRLQECYYVLFFAACIQHERIHYTSTSCNSYLLKIQHYVCWLIWYGTSSCLASDIKRNEIEK